MNLKISQSNTVKDFSWNIRSILFFFFSQARNSFEMIERRKILKDSSQKDFSAFPFMRNKEGFFRAIHNGQLQRLVVPFPVFMLVLEENANTVRACVETRSVCFSQLYLKIGCDFLFSVTYLLTIYDYLLISFVYINISYLNSWNRSYICSRSHIHKEIRLSYICFPLR
jgi:hypothetical protein